MRLEKAAAAVPASESGLLQAAERSAHNRRPGKREAETVSVADARSGLYVHWRPLVPTLCRFGGVSSSKDRRRNQQRTEDRFQHVGAPLSVFVITAPPHTPSPGRSRAAC